MSVSNTDTFTSQPSGFPDYRLLVAIHTAETRSDLCSLAAAALPEVQQQLHACGLDAVACARRITAIVDQLTHRFITFAEDALGPAPGGWAWLAAGSQGRGEQTAYTDQDNALIHADGIDAQAATWFQRLASQVGADLDAAGIPTCSGGVAADQPDWSGDCTTWRQRLLDSVTITDTPAVMRTAQYFDLRVIYGDATLFDPLRAAAIARASSHQRYLHLNAENLHRGRRSIGLLGSWPRVRSGPHRGRISLKQSGLIPISQLAQRLALRGQLTARHTIDRLEAAATAGIIDSRSANDLICAYRLIVQLRLETLIQQQAQQQALSNHIDPSSLSPLLRKVLRAALATVHAQRNALRLASRAD